MTRHRPLAALAAFALAAAPASALAVTFTVNTTDYLAPATPSNTGGLKAAVAYANTHPGTTVAFNIPTSDPGYVSASGYFRIAPPASEFNLPLTVTQSGTVIDATTQTAVANSNPLGPEVYLDGVNVTHPSDPAQYGSDGFRLVNVTGAVLRGFAIGRFNHGIVVVGGGYNTIDGNNVGVSPVNTLAGNLQTGVYLSNTVDNTVGSVNGTGPNLIGGNQHGIRIMDNAYYSIIQGNFIGTDRTLTLNLGNAFNGIRIDAGAHDNRVGGNVIARNNATGVLIYTAAGAVNSVRNNNIFSNRCMAVRIQTAPGPCANLLNDYQDPDTGPNSRQNRPSITTASYIGGVTSISGALNSVPNTTFLIDMYATPTLNPEGYAEGRMPLGTVVVTTNAWGDATFSRQINYNSAGQYITASASRWVGAGLYETSEFSAGYHLP